MTDCQFETVLGVKKIMVTRCTKNIVQSHFLIIHKHVHETKMSDEYIFFILMWKSIIKTDWMRRLVDPTLIFLIEATWLPHIRWSKVWILVKWESEIGWKYIDGREELTRGSSSISEQSVGMNQKDIRTWLVCLFAP